MFGSGIFDEIYNGLDWVSNNAFLVFGVILLIIVIVVLAVVAVK